MLKMCLQVRSSNRPSCAEILKLPQVAKHITETLDGIEARKDLQQNLIGTIRCPLNLGKVTDLMPASNYQTKQSSKGLVSDTASSTALSQIKPMRDVNVRDSRDFVRMASAEMKSERESSAESEKRVRKIVPARILNNDL